MWGPDLKKGLNEVNTHFEALPSEEKGKGITTFAGNPPKEKEFYVSTVWDKHLPGWREKEEVDILNTNFKHDELVKHLNDFTNAPSLTEEDVDFDISNPDALAMQRMVRKKKGSWYQVPKHIEENDERTKSKK
ncbi:hypothetical protein GCM10027297_13490 [Parahaliea aestuarii]